MTPIFPKEILAIQQSENIYIHTITHVFSHFIHGYNAMGNAPVPYFSTGVGRGTITHGAHPTLFFVFNLRLACLDFDLSRSGIIFQLALGWFELCLAQDGGCPTRAA